MHAHRDIGAAIASGTFKTAGMVVAPCSIKSLSEIAHSRSDNPLARSADVCLKERRKLVLLVRATSLHLGHLELKTQATRYGAVVLPPVPALYNRPRSLDDIISQTAGELLDQFDVPRQLFKRGRSTTRGPRHCAGRNDAWPRTRADAPRGVYLGCPRLRFLGAERHP